QRDYIYVKDVVAANVAALVKGENGTFNIGTQVATSVNALYGILSKLHPGAPKAVYAPPRPGELNRSVLNASSAREKLGWHPAFTLEQGLDETYRFFRGQQPALIKKR